MVSLDICNIVASPRCKVHAARLVHHDDLITLRPDDGAETCHLTLARWTARFVAEITRFQALANSPSLLFVPPSLSLVFLIFSAVLLSSFRYSLFPDFFVILFDGRRGLLYAFYCLRSK